MDNVGLTMRDHIVLYINGQRCEVGGNDVFLPLSDFLRYRRGLPGTKLVCSEGDCGACSVLVGRPEESRLRYQVVDSCILFVFQLDAAHVVTVEGLAAGGRLTSVQQAMIDCHGSQCGFCTPGFVVSMTGLLENGEQLQPIQWQRELTGNLCRCTGYTPILEAAATAQRQPRETIQQWYSDPAMLAELASLRGDSIRITADTSDGQRLLDSPTTIAEAIDFLTKHPQAKIVAGATDVGVQVNKGIIAPRMMLDLNRMTELNHLVIENGAIVAGARATWTEILALTEDVVPEFHRIVSIFGAPQIRNVGTIGGNLVNASPIADSLPFLLVMDAQLEFQGPAGKRTIDINQFYQGYKQIDLKPGELLTQVRIPVPTADQILRLYKVSRRLDLDIASFTAALLVQLSGETIDSARLALGAVGPTVFRARRTEAFLAGQPFSEETFRRAGDIAVDEIAPISDVRGSEAFRRQLTRNVLLKFYYEVAQVHCVESS